MFGNADMERSRIHQRLDLYRRDLGSPRIAERDTGVDEAHGEYLCDQRPFSTSTKVLPRRAGEGETVMPAASMAAVLSSAPPLPPEMIAPAWPIRRPGGAVRPAPKPTALVWPRPAFVVWNTAS